MQSAATETEKVTPKKDVIALIEDSNLKRTRMQSIAGEIGERVKHLVETKYLDRAAFSMCAKLVRMEEVKRNAFLRNLELYYDYCREEGLVGGEHISDLVEDAEAAAAAAQAAENLENLKGIKGHSDQEIREFDDATATVPSQRNRRPSNGGDAPGTYSAKN